MFIDFKRVGLNKQVEILLGDYYRAYDVLNFKKDILAPIKKLLEKMGINDFNDTLLIACLQSIINEHNMNTDHKLQPTPDI